ncbi:MULTISPECIES: response regulator transcription factor [Asaia]|uniref:DNA-binding response regulator n=2 Tax=Asaia bogorensis TaxID=91915 RepID=A0AAN4U1N3_9PROT|nr:MULTISPECIES: response regulator transcription factor [Asaia]MDL2170308.1 response regulator transcription factor [Asaia sp. HumB]CDG41281.1 DNA-binding response regulator [Asaia bogorensis]BAT20320.1 two component transcriptional regulator LuxR [Asaia bogorensis NBRC 16594]GBQ79721.1 two component response regulator [Asaia bogorensis NBRC 16594]GEL52258.1 DNA-binding response regulator [Asaia bogorensis NBRC 16594]
MRQKLRLVLAEDQVMLRDAFAALLSMESDFEIVGKAANGLEALTLSRSERPDILLTDIEMPGMSGIELAETLQAEKARTVVVIVTTFARAGYMKRALNAGVRGYLLKDAPLSELAGALRNVGRGGRAIDPGLAQQVWDAAHDPLNSRDRAILRLVESGRSSEQIATFFELSPGTLRNCFSDIIQKIGARNRVEASRIARQNGWL